MEYFILGWFGFALLWTIFATYIHTLKYGKKRLWLCSSLNFLLWPIAIIVCFIITIFNFGTNEDPDIVYKRKNNT